MKHKLIFLRLATERKDEFNGLLYRHTWETGFQDIIFPSQEAAANFLYAIDPTAPCDPDNNAGEALEVVNH